MATPTSLITALSRQLNTQLTLEDGVCALFDQGREVAIVEIPPAGDVAVLHCKIPLRSDPRLHERLLRLNFDIGAMHGCWLALDDNNEVRLCAELPLDALTELAFVHWVQGFIRQTGEIVGLAGQQQSAAPAARPASRPVSSPALAADRRFV